MKKVYDRIVDMRGNLLTVIALNISLGELARIHKQNGDTTYALVIRIEGEKVTETNSLPKLVSQYQVGEKISVKILHKGEAKTIEVTLDEIK